MRDNEYQEDEEEEDASSEYQESKWEEEKTLAKKTKTEDFILHTQTRLHMEDVSQKAKERRTRKEAMDWTKKINDKEEKEKDEKEVEDQSLGFKDSKKKSRGKYKRNFSWLERAKEESKSYS